MSGLSEMEVLCSRLCLDQIACRQFMDLFVQMACREVGTASASILLFDDPRAEGLFRVVAHHDRNGADRCGGLDGLHAGARSFAEELAARGHVMTARAAAWAGTQELRCCPPFDSRVSALIATPLSLNGRLFGAFTCTDGDPGLEPSIRHLASLRRISVRATFALAAAWPRHACLPDRPDGRAGATSPAARDHHRLQSKALRRSFPASFVPSP